MDEEKIVDVINSKGRYDVKRKKYHLYLADSDTHGIGVYIDENILENELVTVLRGRVVFYDPETENNNDYSNQEIQNSIMISPSEILLADSPVLRFINHSCNPNLKISGTRTLISLRKIKKGEQLTIDYSTSENSDWIMDRVCLCGEATCRGKIKGIQELDEKTYLKLYDTIPKNLRYYKR